MYEIIGVGLSAIILCVASVFDIYMRRIPNLLTFSSMIVGIVFTFFFDRGEILSRIICMAILFGIGAIGAMGLGDIKLLMVVASLNDWKIVLAMLGIGALLLVLRCFLPNPKKVFNEIKGFAINFLSQGIEAIDKTKKRYPFAPYLTVGYLIVVIIKYVMKVQ